ncbi:MAG: DNA polymerase III subunit delta [Eubacteriales bacterium]|nr:DNA polymerase III subunit delta [Eubacteriales bacterium]
MSNIYLITGDEQFLKKRKRDELLNYYGVRGSVNFNSFSGEIDYDEVSALSSTMPFFAEHRVILIDGSRLFKLSQNNTVIDMLENLPPSTVIIFYEDEADTTNSLYKLVKKKGEIFSFKKVAGRKWAETKEDKAEIKKWMLKRFKEAGRKINSANIEKLLVSYEYNMERLDNEAEKLVMYTYDRGKGTEITDTDIQEICSKNVTDQVFDMFAAKLTGNIGKALRIYEDLLSIRVKPMTVLYMLAKQFNEVYILKELQNQYLSDAQIAAKMNIKDWKLRNLKQQSSRISINEVRRYLELCVSTEGKIKQGDMIERIGVEIVLCS